MVCGEEAAGVGEVSRSGSRSLAAASAIRQRMERGRAQPVISDDSRGWRGAVGYIFLR